MAHKIVIIANGEAVELYAAKKSEPRVYKQIWNWLSDQEADRIKIKIAELPGNPEFHDMNYPRVYRHFDGVTYERDEDGEYWEAK